MFTELADQHLLCTYYVLDCLTAVIEKYDSAGSKNRDL